jgi:DNA-directed RNA polymerase subunit alpha
MARLARTYMCKGTPLVTADDVVWPAEVDVINPEQVIATIDSPDGVIDMDIWITQDRGYKPAELQESYSIGEIPIDAIYTPIERVNFVVEHTRVGPMTDYDRLIIEVLTDGTIEPDDALAEAARILMTQAQVFAGFTQGESDEASGAGQTIPDEILNKPLVDLGLSPRVLNALRSRQIDRVGQVLTIDPEQLLSIRNFGPRSLTELRQKLAEFGYLPEGEAGLAGVEFLEGIDLGDEGFDELDADLLAASEDGTSEAVASLQGEGVASGSATGGEELA